MEKQDEFNSFVSGVQIKFPWKPYPNQLVLMSRTIQCIKNNQNGLLESATGTGKSLALLCSSLAWQESFMLNQLKEIAKEKEEEREQQREMEKAKEVVAKARLEVEFEEISSQFSGGRNCSQLSSQDSQDKTFDTGISSFFEVNDSSSSDSESDDFIPAKPILKRKIETTEKNKEKKSQKVSKQDSPTKKQRPQKKKKREKLSKIYFATRTHSQVSQLVKELKKTSYKPRMAVLASREQYCIHPDISKLPKDSKNHECKKLVEKHRCSYKSGKSRVVESQRLKKGGEMEIWDIEDLVGLGREKHGCPFYSSKSLSKSADIVFLPYNYIIDPNVRLHSDINLENSIVIFDEAHNIEDVFMEAASGNYPIEDLTKVSPMLFPFLNSKLRSQAQYFIHFFESVDNWIDRNLACLENSESKVWNGADMINIFSGFGITSKNFANYSKNANDLCENEHAPEKDQNIPVLPSLAMFLIENLSTVLMFFFSRDSKYTKDFKLILQKETFYEKKIKKFKYWMNIWCLNPAVACSSISESTRSLILTSGTLAPMESFQSELDVKFDISMEMGHIVNLKTQVYAASISCYSNGVSLKANFAQSHSPQYQDSLAETLLTYANIIPNGVLCFFPSYNFMEKMLDRWKETEILKKIKQFKSIFIEPKKTGREFKSTMRRFYEANKSNRGGLFFAVCRGKVSEGLDFTDENARGVITIGIPFPALKELRIVLKREYNTRESVSNNINSSKKLNGDKWYNLQAFRALNQALGRCIRHKNDWGAIILLDPRFTEDMNCSKISKWVRESVVHYNTVNDSLPSLQNFLSNHKSDNSPAQNVKTDSKDNIISNSRDNSTDNYRDNSKSNLKSNVKIEQNIPTVADLPNQQKVDARISNNVPNFDPRNFTSASPLPNSIASQNNPVKQESKYSGLINSSGKQNSNVNSSIIVNSSTTPKVSSTPVFNQDIHLKAAIKKQKTNISPKCNSLLGK